MFWVTGAEFETTDFDVPKPGTEEEHGPFDNYQTAYEQWSKRAWATVDNCHYKFTIEERP